MCVPVSQKRSNVDPSIIGNGSIAVVRGVQLSVRREAMMWIRQSWERIYRSSSWGSIISEKENNDVDDPSIGNGSIVKSQAL